MSECRVLGSRCLTHQEPDWPYNYCKPALCTRATAALQAEVVRLNVVCDTNETLLVSINELHGAAQVRVRELERPLGAEAGKALLADYPNLQAIVDGTVSGGIAEWPQMRTELLCFLGQYCDRIYRADATVDELRNRDAEWARMLREQTERGLVLTATVGRLREALRKFALLPASDGPGIVAGDNVKQSMMVRSGDIRDARELLGIARGLYPEELAALAEAQEDEMEHALGKQTEAGTTITGGGAA